MNKIERAIYDAKSHINKLEQDRMKLLAKLEAYTEHLNTLEAIERDKSIPYHEMDKPVKEKV